MSTKTIEVKLSEEVHALVKKMAEHGRRKGRGEPEVVTIGEMAADLISTGVFRRIAANKWAKEHAAPKKERKPKAAKKSSSKPRKPAKVVKLKTAKKSKAKKSTPASSSAAAPAAASVLD
jgi:hypothetical protein